MIARLSFANVDVPSVAGLGQRLGLAGTVTGGQVGFGGWGIESSVTVDIALLGDITLDRVKAFGQAVLAAFPSEQAYLLSVLQSDSTLQWAEHAAAVAVEVAA